MFRRILVANRGEIAVRVLRAARELGVEGVAVHSEADRDALHVRMADAAVAIGPAPSAQSYLRAEAIIEAAQATGAEAIHPGYGFLSERASFARQVQDAGLVFIGPSPKAMEAMGGKVSARSHAEAAGVPVAPGSGTLRDEAHARKEAARIGYPVMVKASAGGGGIGMRVVRQDSEMAAQFAAAKSQAEASFGDGSLFLERFLDRPRHIEVQVLGDMHGHVIHLGERECSIQRRHQKLVEEAPSPALDDEARAAIGEKSVALAKRVGYSSAGTLEFLHQDGRFHFNEMNTRLQVEHPVTELVTGIDLVQWQIRIAAGEPLTIRQQDVQLRGHAFEARILAEDPSNGFTPSPGPVVSLSLPSGPGVRVDSGLHAGWTVPPHYDSMVLKLLVHAGDRDAARHRMTRALGELHITGFPTTKPFHEALFGHPAFASGALSTRFIEEHGLTETLQRQAAAAAEKARIEAAAIAVALAAQPGGLAARLRSDTRPAIAVGPRATTRWQA